MKGIYFIDNNLPETCKVIDAMKKYYKDQTQEDLNSGVILINLDGKSKTETIEYYSGVFEKMNTSLKECKIMEDINKHIEEIKGEDVIVLVDLHMLADEEKKIDEDPDYKCISMQCMEELERLGIRYAWYSSYAGNRFKDQWQIRLQEIYGKGIPKIYERSGLIQAHFNREWATEILEV